jgi:hypothetical protein
MPDTPHAATFPPEKLQADPRIRVTVTVVRHKTLSDSHFTGVVLATTCDQHQFATNGPAISDRGRRGPVGTRPPGTERSESESTL